MAKSVPEIEKTAKQLVEPKKLKGIDEDAKN